VPASRASWKSITLTRPARLDYLPVGSAARPGAAFESPRIERGRIAVRPVFETAKRRGTA
jgi:hypothetical protein